MRNRPPDLFVERFREMVAESARHGVAIGAVADAIHVHRSRMYRWRDGENSPEGHSLAALADYWNVSMDWLWGREGYPPGPGLTAEQWAAHAGRALAESGQT